jgi:hypothetical protein
VKRDIGAREYRFSPTPDGAFSAPNRAKDLRSRVAAGGVRVTSRTLGDQGWKLELRLARFGRDQSLADVPEGRVALRGERVEIERLGSQLSEWYTNDERGLEQGWTIASRPAGTGDGGGPLVLELSSSGSLRPLLRPQDGRIVFVDGTGAGRLFYGELVARDAKGVQLESRLAVADGRVQIRVTDRGAAYPIAIDPVIQPASWTVESNVSSGYLGTSVATAGDVNGDGFSDVIVGSPGELSNTGKAYLYLGGPGGLALTPVWTGQGSVAGDSFGASVAAAGNVDGDEFGDVVIGAPNSGLGGYIRVYHGSSNGMLVNPVTLTQANCFSAARSDTHFGQSVATAGDVDGDGFDDVIAGEPGVPIDPRTTSGAVCIYRGSLGTGVSAGSKWVIVAQLSANPGADGDIDQDFFFGTSVSTAGDVNGDGVADVIVGAPSVHTVGSGVTAVGGVFLFLGSGSPGVGPAVPAISVVTGDLDSSFGAAVANAGDLNGDGFADVLVGAPQDNGFYSRAGAVFVFHGSGSGLEVAPSACFPTTVPAQFCASGNAADAAFGSSVATAGDLNGDGYADAVFGMPGWSNQLSGTGAVEFLYGRADGAYVLASAQESLMTSELSGLGTAVATAGDTDGDGFSEVVVGAIYHTNGQMYEGQASLFRGTANPPQTSTSWNFSPSSFARAGDSIATADVNGDGRSDVIVGAPVFDNGLANQGAVFVFDSPLSVLASAPPPSPARAYFGSAANADFGRSVANAGDINDDGFEDVIVGSPGVSHAYLFDGGSTGLPAVASQDLTGPSGTLFGQSVTGAGDVNGDGLGDVVIGAPLDETSGALADEGVVRLYLGSGTGSVVPSTWSAHSGQAAAHFGAVVAGVGDVNRDGFSDVLVGAPNYSVSFGAGSDVAGLVQLFSGNAEGLAPTPSFAVTGTGTLLNHTHIGEDLGYLGDVDADGASDFWFRSVGGLSGVASVRIYRGQPVGAPTLLTSFVGRTAAGGDINGDGLSDLIVGDSSALTVNVFLGPLSSTTPFWTKTGAASSEFGAHVATGDVNGDGVADVLIGAPAANGAAPSVGLVSLFLGNLISDDDGVAVRPFQSDGACLFCILRRISLLGRPTSSPTAFFLSATARSPAGSAQMRLQSELKSLGSSFDEIGIVDGTPVPVIGSAGLASAALSLPSTVPQHWRLRLASSNPFFPHSRWISLFGNGPNESDLRGTVDGDGDGVIDSADNCPSVSNPNQADGDVDGVGDACDNCIYAANPRVDSSFLTTNPWATLTGGQRDDDHDGYGNKCDADFTPAAVNVGTLDVAQFNASNGKSRIDDVCGTAGNRPCAIFDLDEGTAVNIGTPDRARLNALIGLPAGGHAPAGSGKCPSCPLTCQAGTAGTCGPVP